MNLKKNANIYIIILVFIIFTCSVLLTVLGIANNEYINNKYFEKYNRNITNLLREQLTLQASVDNKIVELSNSNEYTLENPYVFINPYKVSPLSSIVIFNTEDEENVKVYINDTLATTTQSSKKHIIPIYGLYSDANNIITLKTSDKEHSFVIKTDILNDYMYDYNIEKLIKKQNSLFVLGDINSQNSMLRAFDKNSNLTFYLQFGYISNIQYNNDSFTISYNTNNLNKNNILLTMNYLGRILAINAQNQELDNVPNLTFDQHSYYTNSMKFYQETIKNEQIKEIIDEVPVTSNQKILTKKIVNELDNAQVYNKEYNLSLMGDYITYTFPENINTTLLVIPKDSEYVYAYNVSSTNTIKIDLEQDAVLYLDVNGTIYNLLTTLKN